MPNFQPLGMMPMKFDLPSSSKVYETNHGLQVSADSREILNLLPAESVDLIVTSPPFALLRQKSYGNEDQGDYVAWLAEFGQAAYRVLKQTGSFVLDLGGAYERGKPVRSLYNFRVLIDFCDRLKYNLAEEFFWYNPAKLPSPIEWVNKRKIRAKDAVNTVWWFSKGEYPKADVTKVLTPYSDRMKTLLKNPGKFYRPKERPSGHDIAAAFGKENGGAIPSNLLQIPNTESTSHYLRMCKLLEKEGHPARFPAALPKFFIEFLTDPGDFVVDIFSGSNTTGSVAERTGRKWLSIEQDRAYAALSAVRFMEHCIESDIIEAMKWLDSGQYLKIGPAVDLSADDASDAQPMAESQGSLFKDSRTGTR
jgi:DNA modification methylase